MNKRIWAIVDRNKGRIIDFKVGNDNIENANLLMYNLLSNNNKLDLTTKKKKKEIKEGKGNKNKNKDKDKIITIGYLCTDGHHIYNVVDNYVLFKDHIKHHVISKKKTRLENDMFA